MKRRFKTTPFTDQVLKGFSQVMLQENSLTGILFIIGIFIGNWHCGIAALLATLSGTLWARLRKYDRHQTDQGLYGFSPALTGVVIILFFSPVIPIWLLVIAGGIAAAWLQHFFIVRGIPAYTFPFIIVAWVSIFLVQNYSAIPSPEKSVNDFDIEQYWFFSSIIKGYGQVIFQSSLVAGILFFIGVVISDARAGLNGFAASLAGVILSLVDNQPGEQLQAGLFGFNAVLTAIALSMDKKTRGSWAALGVVITIAIHNILIDYHVLDVVGGVFTFPFVLGTWITLAIYAVVYKDKQTI